MEYRALILHNIRSMENVGSMFRTADAFRVSTIYLTGYTPAPLDRFQRPVGKIAKTALGAEHSVPWERGDLTVTCAALKSRGIHIVALEQDARSMPLASFDIQGGAAPGWALVVGNEVDGLDEAALGLADCVVEIEMHGEKESLNVAVAAGIALWELAKKSDILRQGL